MRDTIQFLTSEISRHDQLYYIACRPEISDQQYDAMFAKLVCLEAEHPEHAHPNSPTSRIGSNITNNFRKYPHPEPMLSVKSFYSEAELTTAIARHPELVSGPAKKFDGLFCIEHKLDGISIELEYHNGQLFRALTRGDGTSGEDVTDNIRTIKSIPLVLSPSPSERVGVRLLIRGEIIITEQGMKEVNKLRRKNKLDPYPNQRNAAASLVMFKNSGELAQYAHYLEALFYYICDSRYQANNLLRLQRMGFKTPWARSVDSVSETIETFKTLPSPLYPTDGFVVKVNDREIQTKLGQTTRHVNWAWALKERSDTIHAPFTYIDYSISANGTITPIVHFHPVKHNGIIYKCAKVTWNDLETWQISKGSILEITIKGSVSASITGVLLNSATDHCQLPTSCPCCKSPFLPPPPVGRAGVGLRCVNPLCPEKTGDWQYLLSEGYKKLTPMQHEPLSQLRFAAVNTNACIVRTTKGASRPTILYRSIDQLAQIAYISGTL